MKRTLMASAAVGALFMGATITGPALHTGFVTPAAAQDSTTTPPPADSGASDDAAPADEAPADDSGSTGTNDAGSMDSGDEPPADDAGSSSGGMGSDSGDTSGSGSDDASGGMGAGETGTEGSMDSGTPPADDASSSDDPAAGDDAAAAEGSGEMFMPEQAENEVSANTYIGQSLYNMEDESIGNINDLIFSDDGGVTTAVVGVGGFLGIGQKNVGVNFDMITIEQQPDSADVRLIIEATREDLEAAPEYVTLDEKMAEQQSSQPATGGTGMGGTTGGMGTGGGATTTPAQ